MLFYDIESPKSVLINFMTKIHSQFKHAHQEIEEIESLKSKEPATSNDKSLSKDISSRLASKEAVSPKSIVVKFYDKETSARHTEASDDPLMSVEESPNILTEDHGLDESDASAYMAFLSKFWAYRQTFG